MTRLIAIIFLLQFFGNIHWVHFVVVVGVFGVCGYVDFLSSFLVRTILETPKSQRKRERERQSEGNNVTKLNRDDVI